MKKVLVIFLSIIISVGISAQDNADSTVSKKQKELFNKVALLDSVLFTAYNSKNLDLMKTYFSREIEWYQDNGGLIYYE